MLKLKVINPSRAESGISQIMLIFHVLQVF